MISNGFLCLSIVLYNLLTDLLTQSLTDLLTDFVIYMDFQRIYKIFNGFVQSADRLADRFADRFDVLYVLEMIFDGFL